MILWDSKKRGERPNTMQLLKDTWTSFEAEVIFFTFNMQGNDEMMQACREGMYLPSHSENNFPLTITPAGLHAFGTHMWDF